MRYKARSTVLAAVMVLVLFLSPLSVPALGESSSAGLRLVVKPSEARPGEAVNVTVAAAPYTLVTMVFRVDGYAVVVKPLKVYSGVVKSVGRMLIVVTSGSGLACFSVRAPSRPGVYVVEASSALGGSAEAVLRVVAPSPLYWLLQHRVLVAVAVAVLVAVAAYLWLTGAAFLA